MSVMYMEIEAYAFICAYILLMVALLLGIIIRTSMKNRNECRLSTELTHRKGNETTCIVNIKTANQTYQTSDIECFEVDGEVMT